ATKGPYVINANHPDADATRAHIESLPGYDASLWNANRTAYNGVNIFGSGAATTFSPNNALYVPGITWVNQGRTTMQIQDGLTNWFMPLYGQRYRTAWGTPENPAANAPVFPTAEADISANPTWANVYNRNYAVSTGWSGNGNNIVGYKYPGVTDRSVYDWEN